MTTKFWEQLKQAAQRCQKTYTNPTNRFENEQIIIDENHVLTVTIAGSNDVWDWIQNVNLDQVKLGQWKVSEGMLSAAKNVMAMVDDYRFDNPQSYVKPLVFEGHSKGGAVAIICGLMSEIRHNKVERVTTFGAPRLTTSEIIYPFRVDQIETKGDPIPKIPVWKPWSNWRHNGRTIRIGKQTSANIGREWFGFIGRSVKKHLIRYYLEILE